MFSCTYVRGGEWCGRVRETTYLVSEHTKPYVKAQLVGLLLGLVDTLKAIIRFDSNLGKTILKKSCTRTRAWRLLQSQGRARDSTSAQVCFESTPCCC